MFLSKQSYATTSHNRRQEFLCTTQTLAACLEIYLHGLVSFVIVISVHAQHYNYRKVQSLQTLQSKLKTMPQRWTICQDNASALFLFCWVPSVPWRCWLGGRKGIPSVKNWVVGCWRGYLSGARCRLHVAQLMPLPLTVSCFSKIQLGFTFLVPAHLGSLGQRAVKRACVCVVWADLCFSKGNRNAAFGCIQMTELWHVAEFIGLAI